MPTSRADFESYISSFRTLHDTKDGLLGYTLATARELFDEVERLNLEILKLGPHWKCTSCGSITRILDDSTQCKCRDLYDEEWIHVSGVISTETQGKPDDQT